MIVEEVIQANGNEVGLGNEEGGHIYYEANVHYFIF
jgi:hypothetical protein